MSELANTPAANRVHIAFFGLRNAGKSTLVNAFCGQEVAIVDSTPGTTTDPVSKAMEILPLGPCLVTDTAGLDDEGVLGKLRVAKSLAVLKNTDIAIWVEAPDDGAAKANFLEQCARLKIVTLTYRRGDSVAALKSQLAAVEIDPDPGLLEGMVVPGDRVVLVCPIDSSAPKGRLILPQVQVLRECLDRHAVASVCQPSELANELSRWRANGLPLVITDSQAFREVSAILEQQLFPAERLTSFSILFARQKGDLDEYRRGLAAIDQLKDGDLVLIAEACTHHRQCNDIGTTKIPAALTKLSGGRQLRFEFASGRDFLAAASSPPRLIVHCGGCMLTRRAMLARIAAAKAANIPIVNYGLLLQAALSRFKGLGMAVGRCPKSAADLIAPNEPVG